MRSATLIWVFSLLLFAAHDAQAQLFGGPKPIVDADIPPNLANAYKGNGPATLSRAISGTDSVVAHIATNGVASRFYVRATFQNGDVAIFYRVNVTGSPQFFTIPGTVFRADGTPICSYPSLSTKDPDNRATDVCNNLQAGLSCDIEVSLCATGAPQTLVTAVWPGQNLSSVDIDYLPTGSTSWLPIYSGNPSCANVNNPFNPIIARAFVQSLLGEYSYCTVTIQADNCDGGFIF